MRDLPRAGRDFRPTVEQVSRAGSVIQAPETHPGHPSMVSIHEPGAGVPIFPRRDRPPTARSVDTARCVASWLVRGA